MASIKLTGDTSGEITISAPAVAGTNTLTLPAHTGTVMVDGPAFAATRPSDQNVTAGVWTKVVFDSEIFDTDSCYDNATNYRFTPTVAGYYQINLEILFASSGSSGAHGVSIRKNGSVVLDAYRYAGGTATGASTGTTAIAYCNGSTDYIEAYALYTGTSPQFDASSVQNHFSAVLVRAA